MHGSINSIPFSWPIKKNTTKKKNNQGEGLRNAYLDFGGTLEIMSSLLLFISSENLWIQQIERFRVCWPSNMPEHEQQMIVRRALRLVMKMVYDLKIVFIPILIISHSKLKHSSHDWLCLLNQNLIVSRFLNSYLNPFF